MISMGAPTEYFDKLAEEIASAKTQTERDLLLDEWWDAANRATDYDAMMWDFNPSSWMSEARRLMERRIAEQRAIQRSKR